jgi:hypothetical protein
VRGVTVQEAEDSYRRASESILQVATSYHQAPIVVTARKASYQQRAGLAGFTLLEVLDFREEDIQQFIRSWFDCRPIPSRYATAADLQARLARNQRIQALAANPLLLSLIVLVYEEQLSLTLYICGKMRGALAHYQVDRMGSSGHFSRVKLLALISVDGFPTSTPCRHQQPILKNRILVFLFDLRSL